MNECSIKNFRSLNNTERLTLDIIDCVNETLLVARRMKAVTDAFSEAFTECSSGANWEEVQRRPEHFCYLFSAIHALVYEVNEAAQAADEASSKWIEDNNHARYMA